MTDSIETPTANMELSTMVSSKIVSTAGCDKDQQPEMATWPQKPEIVYLSLEIWQHRNSNGESRARRARRNCPHAINYTTDNGNGNVAAKTGNICISETAGSTGILGFRPLQARILPFPGVVAVAIIWRQFYRARHARKALICVGLLMLSVTVPEIYVFHVSGPYCSFRLSVAVAITLTLSSSSVWS